ncbi:MAG: hypothetical protein ACRC33_10505 [Gemmataceae bacterium]
METYLTRICWNANRWERPSGDAPSLETPGQSFVAEHGFGFEEWLNDRRLALDGWRYGFTQGVNKSQLKLAGHTVRLLFYAIGPGRQRYLVGGLKRCSVLTQDESDPAHERFEADGTINRMIDEVRAVKGEADFIKDKTYLRTWTLDFINLICRQDDLCIYPRPVSMPRECDLVSGDRYQLTPASAQQIRDWEAAASLA